MEYWEEEYGFEFDIEPDEDEAFIYVQLDKDNNAYILFRDADGNVREIGKQISPMKQVFSIQACASQTMIDEG